MATDWEQISPLKDKRYAEYRDADFLRAVGLCQYESQLAAFWPRRGPCWDALARYRDGCILVEAKSHVAEIYGGGCAASEKSQAAIQASLAGTKQWLGVPMEADWLEAYTSPPIDMPTCTFFSKWRRLRVISQTCT